MTLIAPRWRPISEELRIPELPGLSLEECDEVEGIASEGSGEGEEEGTIQMRMSNEGHNLNHRDVEEDSVVALHERGTSRTRYLSMFHLAKQITQNGSNAPWRYEEPMGTVTGIVEFLSEPVDGEIRDATGRQRAVHDGLGTLILLRHRLHAVYAAVHMLLRSIACIRHLLWRKLAAWV
jgi:hypothetical protein